jgi:hypothetical protein
MNTSRISPVEAARALWRERYACPRVIFLAGSVMRAFDALFAGKQKAPVIALVEEMLEPFGGFLFHGFRKEAEKRSDE